MAALSLILALMGTAAVGALAVANYRSAAARQLERVLDLQEHRHVAEGVLDAAAAPEGLDALLADPAALEAWLGAFTAGEYAGGVLTPGDPGLTLHPPQVVPAEDGWEISPVRVRAVEYLPGRNLGVLRLSVDVGRGSHVGTFAQDYEFGLRGRVGGGLVLVAAPAPAGRIY
jgi:hypothetical protein